MDPWLKFMSLEALAERRGKDVGYLLTMAASGALRLSVPLEANRTIGACEKFSGYAGLTEADARRFLLVHQRRKDYERPIPVKVSRFLDENGGDFQILYKHIVQRATSYNRFTNEGGYPEVSEYRPGGSMNYFVSDLVVMADEVARLDAESLELRTGAANMKVLPSYLDSSRAEYAPKLAAAIAAWEAVALEALPRNMTPKQAIIAWLEKNAFKYGLQKEDGSPNKQGIEEVAKVANWKPQGPPKTGE